MTYENIKFESANQIAVITLNIPEKLNACSLDMADEINDALDHLGNARALIITGEGKGFCSGADLSGGRDGGISGGLASYRALTRHYNPMLLKLHRLAIPTISAVNGAAAGIGCSISLAPDFVICSSRAYFLQAFVNIGLVPDGGASWMLPRLIGGARATQMMMLGEKISGEQAAEWGLIYKCVEDAELMTEARALATRLANGPTLALGMMRQNIATALEMDYANALNREAEAQKIAGESTDAREGELAFLQKRKPQFKGQ